jgi:hypothetical protein
VESGRRKAREWRRVQHRRPKRGMHGSTPQGSGSSPWPSGPFRTGENVTGRQAEEALPGTRPAGEDPNPVWECTSSSPGEGAVGTQDGATSEKATFSEPPARSRTEILGLD